MSEVIRKSTEEYWSENWGEDQCPKPVELGLRFFYNYNFVFVGGIDDDDHSFYGAGLKVNLPGFFWMGSSYRDFKPKSKKKPFNTSLHTYIYDKEFLNDEGGTSSSLETVFGLSMDLFITQDLFLTLGLSSHDKQGDYFWGTSVGLGIEF